MSITHQSKEQQNKETSDLIAEFLAKGGQITKVKPREMDHELGLSNNVWGKKLTKEHRALRAADQAAAKAAAEEQKSEKKG